MVTATFGDSAAKEMISEFGLDVDEGGFVVKNNQLVKDGAGEPIPAANVGGIVYLEECGFSVDSEGFVVDEGGRVSNTFDTAPRTYDAIVPFETPDGRQAGLLRSLFPSIVDYVQSRR